MKEVVIYFGFLFAFIACVHGYEKIYYDINKAPELFVKYMKDYDKSYEDEYHLLVHYEAFKKSLKTINISNKLNPSAIYDLNYLADWTPEQIKHLLGNLDVSDTKGALLS